MDDSALLSLTKPGNFVIGCNYWASHAGTRMWSDWREEIVEDDLAMLANAGLQVLRIFPLWPDFQPIHLLRAGQGHPQEIRFGESPLPDTEAGRAGMAQPMLDRFKIFADLAHRNHLKLIVGLLTGWMSGRLYVPPALEGLNVLTDPLAIQWSSRFVRQFVRTFKNHPAILAWDLGNECNCMAATTREESWAWTSTITCAIRAEDGTRPVVSGMHSLAPGNDEPWTMQDQGELTDLLTTHPYPYFTPHADQDPVNTIRTILHSTAESRFYADIGGKPCIAEELGTLGPILASERVAAEFVRACLFSLWANDCHGLLWWCAFDQDRLEHAPYDWNACERELGLVRNDRSIKPVLAELGKFRAFLDGLPIRSLPSLEKEAVCILSHDQDQWGAAYTSFILAKQSGFEIEFQFADQPIRPAALYLLPSVSGMAAISRRRWLELLEHVSNGAVLFVSHNDGLLSPFNQPFGLEPQTRSRRSGETTFEITGAGQFKLPAPVRLELHSTGAQVLGVENDGNPVFTVNSYGKGKIYFLSLPLELALANRPGAFDDLASNPYWRIYRLIADPIITNQLAVKSNPAIGLTEHPLNSDKRIIILINYSPRPQADTLTLAMGWRLAETWYGGAPTQVPGALVCQIPPNDALVLTLEREQ